MHSLSSLYFQCKKECVNKLIADIQDRLLDEYKIMLKDEHVEGKRFLMMNNLLNCL